MSDELPLYQIVDWNVHFENHKSRKLAKCGFVCVPNKHGGAGLTALLMSGPEPYGHAYYGIWQLILQFCSRQPVREGWLTGDGKKNGPRMPASEWARMFRCSAALIRSTFNALRMVGFIVLVEGTPEMAIPVAIPSADQTADQTADSAADSAAEVVATPAAGSVAVVAASDQTADSAAKGVADSAADERKNERKKEPPSVPQRGTERNGHQSVDEAKAWINSFFGRQREWSYEETRLLSELMPISKEDRALLSWAYMLPRDREGWVIHNGTRLSKRKESVLLLLEQFGSEIDKWRGKKQGLIQRVTKPVDDEPIPEQWATTMRELYGPEICIPRTKNLLAPSVRQEIETVLAGIGT
jgi:hypothetical protein